MTMTDKSRARMEELVDHLSKTKELHPAMGYDVERAFSDGYISGLQDPDASAESINELLKTWPAVRYALSLVIRSTNIDGDIQANARIAYSEFEKVLSKLKARGGK